MAAKSYSSIIVTIFNLLFIVSVIPQSVSQSAFPQNIQTFFPFSIPRPSPAVLSPPPPANEQPSFPPPTTPLSPSRQQMETTKPASSKKAVGKAIGVTAASTLVLSGLLFFLLLWYSRRKKERKNSTVSHGANTFVPQNDKFMPFKGRLKAVIVDENGLDVLYWKNLEEGENRSSFKKQYYRNLKDDQKEEKREVSNGVNRPELPVQERPLLRGKSSTSQSPIWVDKENQMIKNSPVTPPPPQLSSALAVAKGKTPAPPPPPPPPPKPPLAVEVVPKERVAAPPPIPPPPPPNAGASAISLKPPPPKGMPSSNKRSSSLGEGTSSGNRQVKLKPLHWDKVNPDVNHSMVWNKIDQGSFNFDGDLMEALFGCVATNRKSPKGDNKSVSPRGDTSGPPSQIFILNSRKSQNTAIVLKSLGVTRKEIIDALNGGHGLSVDTLEKLTRIAPTSEEESEILAFDGDPTRLADAESFLYHLLKAVPSSFTRFNTMLFRSNYDLEISHLKEFLQSLESACKELRTRGLFLKLLEAVLKAGNRLNAGTSRGNAQAFNLTALRKLSDVKSTDGKTSLLQFVVQEVVRAEGKRCVLNRTQSFSSRSSSSGSQSSDSSVSEDEREREYMILGLPVIGGLSTEFSNVKKAATTDPDLLKTSSELAAQVTEIRKTLAHCGSDGGFAREMKAFLDSAELEIQLLREEQTRVMELVRKTTEYYQTVSSKDKGAHPLQLFIIVKDFLGMIDQVCIEIARNVQKRQPASSVAGSSSPGSPRVFRFPKLPSNFMSDQSKSSTSDSDDDSEVSF